jgi:GNAT superfamily N-acetyltransferase
VQAVIATLTEAFASDPVWSRAFPLPAQREVWWRFWVGAAVPQGWVRVLEDAAAAAVWIPPGGRECAAEDEAHVRPLLEVLVGERADTVLETLDRFEAHHPRDAPHYYLSLLGTATAQRGRGLGMALLAENLERIDHERMPAYLESSNPANLGRYESVGFAPREEFTIPGDSTVVTTMWREPHA